MERNKWQNAMLIQDRKIRGNKPDLNIRKIAKYHDFESTTRFRLTYLEVGVKCELFAGVHRVVYTYIQGCTARRKNDTNLLKR